MQLLLTMQPSCLTQHWLSAYISDMVFASFPEKHSDSDNDSFYFAIQHENIYTSRVCNML